MKNSPNIQAFIETSLSQPIHFFIYSLEALIDEEIEDIQEMLKADNLSDLHTNLVEIVAVKKEIEKKDGWFIQGFRNLFGIERNIASKEKYFNVLVEKVKSDNYRIKLKEQALEKKHLQIVDTLIYLEALKRGYLTIENKKINIHSFIKEIESRIVILETYKRILRC